MNAAENMNPAPEQSVEKVEAIERERIERINDWLASTWRGSRANPEQEMER